MCGRAVVRVRGETFPVFLWDQFDALRGDLRPLRTLQGLLRLVPPRASGGQMAAPDLPRWIDDPRVDSQAMLSAFLSRRSPDLFLPTEYHACAWDGLTTEVSPPGVLRTRCTASPCQRCAGLQGGYKFRWYHHSWYQRYLLHRRLVNEGLQRTLVSREVAPTHLLITVLASVYIVPDY